MRTSTTTAKRNHKKFTTPEGTGQQSKFAFKFHMKLEGTVNGEPIPPMDLKGEYNLELTTEMIQYAIQRVAGEVARVASNIAQPATNGGGL